MPASADLLERRPVGRLLPTTLLFLTVSGPISPAYEQAHGIVRPGGVISRIGVP